MEKRKLYIFIALALLCLQVGIAQSDEVILYYFYGDGCPHCAHAKVFLDEMSVKYPGLEVRSYETWKDNGNYLLFTELSESYGASVRGVPTFFIGHFSPVIGYGGDSTTGKDLENKIVYCRQNGCIDPMEKLAKESPEPIEEDELCIHIFIDQNCPECANTKSYIDSIDLENLLIYFHDIDEAEEKDLYDSFKKAYGLKVAGYPIMFVGDNYFLGQDAIIKNLESIVAECREGPCPCPAGKISGITPAIPQKKDFKSEGDAQFIELPILGTVDIGSMSLLVMTLIISFIDGFNPCSLWVLTFLLGIVIYSGSRKKIVIVGTTFLLVTASAYGLFMLGLINVFTYIGFTNWIRIGVAAIATLFAVVNIKDYFWYKKGISFTISDKHKPSLYKKVRNVMNPSSSIWAMIGATVLLALGIVLVELPCTAGFPMMWTSIMAQHGVSGLEFALLFATYLFIYLVIELVIFFGAVISLKASRFEERHGRILKLVGGIIMLALAAGMLFFPDAMNSIAGSIYIFGIAGILSALVLFIHRVILPNFGIRVGTEDMHAGSEPKEESKEESKEVSKAESKEVSKAESKEGSKKGSKEGVR